MVADPLVANAIKTIKAIAEGNDVSADEIVISGARRQDYAVTLQMLVEIAWRWKSSYGHGANHPENSRHVSDSTSAEAWLTSTLTALSGDPAVSEALAVEGRVNTKNWFEKLAEGDRVGRVERRCHFHEGCRDCGRTGEVKCTNPFNVRFSAKTFITHVCVTSCHQCAQTGKQKCHCTDGKIYRTEYYYEHGATTQSSRQVALTCQNCNGTGRSYINCYSCSGAGVVPCTSCGGRGIVTCNSCKGTGWFTRSYVGWLEARPKKSFKFEKATSATAAASLGSMSALAAMKQCALGAAKVSHTAGQVMVEIQGMFPEVLLALEIGEAGQQRFGFLGTGNLIRLMPTFLDNLLLGRFDRISEQVGAKDWLGSIQSAQGARLTQSTLTAVVNRKVDIDRLALSSKGAISTYLLVDAAASLKLAFGSLGSQATSGFWKLVLLPLVLLSFAVPALSINRLVALSGLQAGLFRSPALEAVGWGTMAALALMPIGTVWVTARGIARRKILALTGEASRRPPSLGRWGTAAMTLTAVSLCGGLATRHWSTSLPPQFQAALERATPAMPPGNMEAGQHPTVRPASAYRAPMMPARAAR